MTGMCKFLLLITYVHQYMCSAKFQFSILLLLRICISSLEGHDSTVWSIAFEPSGNRLGTNSMSSTYHCNFKNLVSIFSTLYSGGLRMLYIFYF